MYVILSRNSHDVMPFNDWIGDVANLTAVITKNEHVQTYSPFFKTIGLENYDNFEEKIKAMKIIENYDTICNIVALSEFDLEDAAKCREFFKIQGQSVRSATAFRNKLIMKEFVAEADIPITKYSNTKTIDQIITFGKVNGFPIIVKPIDGGGSVNTCKFDNEKDIRNQLESNSDTNYLCEVFVSGDMIHCDGIYENGEIKLLSISEYIGNCLSYQVGKALASYQLEKCSRKWRKGERMLKRVLAALPCPQIMGFHAEFFVTEDGELVFCEIASRLGGVRVIDSVEFSHKISMVSYWVRRQLNLQSVEIKNPDTDNIYGYVSIPPKVGVLKYIPDYHPFYWVYGYRKHYNTFEIIMPAQTSVDSIVSYVVKAKSAHQIKSRIKESIKWFTEHIKYEH